MATILCYTVSTFGRFRLSSKPDWTLPPFRLTLPASFSCCPGLTVTWLHSHNAWPVGRLDPGIRPQRGIGPQPDKPEPPPSSHWKTRGTLMVNSESGHEEESGREGKMVLIWSSLKLYNTYSDFIRGQRWSLMSAALAVIGVTVFVCLTLCKRGLGSGGWRHGKRGGGGGEDTKRKREFWTLPVRLWHCSMDKSMSKRNHCFK